MTQYTNTHGATDTMLSCVPDTESVRARSTVKEGQGCGVTRMVDTAHSSGADELFVWGGKGPRKPGHLSSGALPGEWELGRTRGRRGFQRGLSSGDAVFTELSQRLCALTGSSGRMGRAGCGQTIQGLELDSGEPARSFNRRLT